MKTFPSHPTGGFTLAEITLSVGIAAVCLLPLLGLMPYGLDSLRQSANRQAEARMTQTVVSSYQMATWVSQNASGSREIVLQDKTFFFDQTGTELSSASDPERMYVVQAKVLEEPDINKDPTRLKGDSSRNPYLRVLRLRFTDRPDHATAFQDGSGQYVERPVWISNVEQTGPLSSLAATP